ncbi:hypothetical protein [Asticcacaulis sp.]|uniref:hypothetical protein n=1 Tax=Asticcacaulis sp. TaxID=1872648 RepID=UPI0026016275|nr:hypothetical protein [Asticcacaulis sp.]
MHRWVNSRRKSRVSSAWKSTFSTQDEARRHIRVLLGGRAAEELRFGSVGLGSGGSTQSDLARATSVATAMIAGHGLGSRLLWLGDADPDTISAFLRAYPSLADEVSRLLAVEHEEVMALLRPRVQLINEMASILVAHGTMIGAEVEELVSSVRVAQK